MDSPASIPAGFPQAAELKARQDEFESLVEQARGHQKVPVGTLISGVSGLVQLVQLQAQLQTYLGSSGSGSSSLTKIDALRTATGYMLNTLAAEHAGTGINNTVGIVTFSSTATVLAPLTGDPASLEPKTALLEATASTNIGDGLKQAIALLDGRPAPAIILLSDGWNNEGMTNAQILAGPVAEAAAKDIPVCTIGLGTSPYDVDQRLLDSIAATTGGGYYFVPDRVSLTADMESCHHSAAGQQLIDYRGKLAAGSTVSAPAFTVPAGKRRLTVTATAPETSIKLELADSTGRVIPSANTVGGPPGLAVATVINPPAGPVSARVSAQQVNPGSQDVFISASTDGPTTSRHLTAIQAGSAASGPLGQQRMQIRQALTAAAIITGLCFLGLSIRGLRQRIRVRRTGKRGGTFLVPLVLVPGAVLGLIALAGAAVLNILWELPLIPMPNF